MNDRLGCSTDSRRLGRETSCHQEKELNEMISKNILISNVFFRISVFSLGLKNILVDSGYKLLEVFLGV